MITASELADRYTVKDLEAIIEEACDAAYTAASTFHHDVMQGDWGLCGFAWVNIYGIKGNTKMGRRLKEVGFRKSYDGGLQFWNPSRYPTQSVDTLEAGARAAAVVFKRYGFDAFAGSRLD